MNCPKAKKTHWLSDSSSHITEFGEVLILMRRFLSVSQKNIILDEARKLACFVRLKRILLSRNMKLTHQGWHKISHFYFFLVWKTL